MTACQFIAAGHPFEPEMERIRQAIAAVPAAATADTRTVRQHELKGTRNADGAWRLDRFYSSVHSWNAADRAPFDAVTYHYSGAEAAGSWFRFPREPYLSALDRVIAAEQPEVLQYVVLRRLTYRARTNDGSAYIGKFKRRSRARGAFEVLSRISAAARQHPLSFRIPGPLGYHESEHHFLQEALPGHPVNDLVRADTLESLLAGVGRVHAELHGLPAADLPGENARARFETLARDCDWITFFRPSASRPLHAVRDLLLDIAPGLEPAPMATCHGDFVCSHVLHGAEGWAVVDFDLAHRGDPHADAAVLLSSLTNDVPMIRSAWRESTGSPDHLLDRAAEAYLAGYQSFGGHVLERRPLLWHRIAAEIHMLALMFTKDRFHPLAFDRGLGLIDKLASQLASASDGAA